MSDNNKQVLATQAANTYKGKICCYANVTRRKMKDHDPALAFSKTSSVGINIFDPTSTKGVKYFLDSTLPSFIFEKTRICMLHSFMNKLKNVESAEKTPAYTVKLKRGEFKDRTPAEILTNNPEKYNALTAYYNELVVNAGNPQYAKYQKMNEEQAKAIKEACALYAQQKLKKTVSYPKIPIHDGIKTPDISKVDKNGNTEVRIIKIFYDTDPGNNEPYSIEITNCMAPPVQGSLVGAKLSKAVNSVTLMMTFTEEIWFGFWKDVIDAKDAFARLMESDRIVYSEKEMWKPQAQTQNQNVTPYTGPIYGQPVQPGYGYPTYAS